VPVRQIAEVLAIGSVAAGITLGISLSSFRHVKPIDARALRASGAAVRLAAPNASYVFNPATGHIVATTEDGAVARDIEVEVVVDGEARPLALERSADRATERNAFGASFEIAIGEETFDALVSFRVDAAGALTIDLAVEPDEATGQHQFALRIELPASARSVFASGMGELADLGPTSPAAASALEIDADPHAIGIVPASGVLDVASTQDTPDARSSQLRVAATTRPQVPTPNQPAQFGLRFEYAESSATIWRTIAELQGIRALRVAGLVTGATERGRVFGLDAEGRPRVRAPVGEDGRFEVYVPPAVTLWYAAIDAARTSTPVTFTPGSPWDLHLDVSPGGELTARVLDADTGQPLVARLLVHGIDGTLDPSFGPDYRASGAGPIVDTRDGVVTTPLPTGRYRVAATRGIEWSIDAKTVDVGSGRHESVDLALRHVVPTPGVVSCDLHVHARPSFDTPVLVEDRVLSLVSAGIDFAVPSEHNLIGDYGAALETLGLAGQLATVTGVEITTFAPRFGHFGLFPYPTSGKIPPYKATDINNVFNFARRAAPTAILQVNHPRLKKGIGYFDVFHFDPKRPPPLGMRTDFDTLEVYNGYESRTPEDVDLVLHDWFALLNLGHRYAATGSSDSHRIQYQWAGYPRTMASVGEDAAGDRGAPIDTQALVAAIRKGHSFVTSGPIIELDVAGAHPGDNLATEDATLRGHVRVRAAPWIDVTSAEVVVGGESVESFRIPPRPTIVGAELGGLEEAQARTIRYDADVTIPVGAESSWIVVIVRGDRPMDDVLPFMPVPPRAFTNPIYVVRAVREQSLPQGAAAPRQEP
jgi:hypothetical protein